MTKTVKLAGKDIPVIDREVTEEDTVLCMRKADVTNKTFTDNQEAPCMDCGETVVFRPYMARGNKLCVQCAMQRHGGRPLQ